VAKFDLEYARKVIKAEADAIVSVMPIVDGNFAKAVEMIYNCAGSVIVTGKSALRWHRPEHRVIFCTQSKPFMATSEDYAKTIS
jgi:hypothetical protein